MDSIDFRSDTVTWPTPAMREAMANAAVGDDVYGEDPTVNQLEAEAAAKLGKEAGLFVTSGTQGNLTAVLAHCGRGDEIIVGRSAHTFYYEAGGAAALGGVNPMTLEVQPDGTLALDEIRSAIRPDNIHYPRTKLICLENTYGATGGTPVSAEYTAQVGEIAHENGLKLHIDGARIFNAATALKIPIDELVAPADSVTFCLSKGLCAPVGSILVGSTEFIQEARRVRKSLGGGMRQVGILAAAGLIALREMTQRLQEDHDNACLLAEGLLKIPHVHLDLAQVQTNMILFSVDDSAPISIKELITRMKEDYNVVLSGPRNGKFRAVTHYWIKRQDVEHTLDAMRTLLS